MNSRFKRSTAIFSEARNQIAAKAHGSKITLLALAATLQPCSQNFRVKCLDLSRSRKSHIIRANREPTTDPHLSHAGGAEFKTIEIPSVRAAADVATHVLDAVPSERDEVDA